MIRRGFWLTTGAVTGIVAYRRVSMVGRRLSSQLNLDASTRTASTRTASTRTASTRTASTRTASTRTASTRTASAGTASVGRRPAGQLLSVRRTRRGAIRAARETYRFTRDVREGMALHTAQRSGPNLSPDHDAQPEDGY